MFVLLFAALKVAGQTTGYLRFDTVKIMKQNGTCELYIINKTKDSLGLLTNIGGGLTSFKRSRTINDSMIIVGLDTLIIKGTGSSGGSGITELTGDVIAGPGTGSQAATIATNVVTDAKLRQSAGLSVIGRSANSTGNVADITAGNDGEVLRRSGTTVGFGAVNLASSNAVTGVLPVANGGSGSATPALLSDTNLSITGSWPGQTISIAPNTLNYINYLNKPVPINSNSIFLGNSITYGYDAILGTIKPYPDYLKDYLNVSSITNLAISGSGVRLQYRQFAENFNASYPAPLVTMMGFNNLRGSTDTIHLYETVRSGHRATAALLFAKPSTIQFYAVGTSGVVNPNITTSLSCSGCLASSEDSLREYGSRSYWYRHNDATNTGANWWKKASITANETVTISNVEGPGIIVSTWAGTTQWSRIEVRVDGTLMTTYDPNGRIGTYWNDGFIRYDICNDAIVVLGLRDTLHVVQLKFLDGGVMGGFDFVAGIKSQIACLSTPMYVLDIPHMNATGYSYPGGVVTEAQLDSCTESRWRDLNYYFPGYSFARVNENAPGYYDPNDPTQIQSDGIHPANIGQWNIARALIAATGPKWLTGGIAGGGLDPVLQAGNTSSRRIILTGNNQTLPNFEVGSDLLFQVYNPSNSWLASNIYFDGSNFKYKHNGVGAQFYFNSGYIEEKTAASGSTGGTATINTRKVVTPTGDVYLGGDITNSVNGAGAKMLIDGTSGNVTIPNVAAIGPTSYSLGLPIMDWAVGSQGGRAYYNASGATNEKVWDMTSGANTFNFRMANDAYALTTDWLTVTRSGYTSASLNFPAGNVGIGISPSFKLDVNGKASIRTTDSSGSPANMAWIDPNTKEVKIAAVPSGGVSGSGTSGRIAYWNGSSSLTSSSNFLFSTIGPAFSAGTTNTQGVLNLGGNKDLSSSGVQSYFAGATYTDQSTSSGGTSSSFDINYIAAPTIAAANTSVTFPAISTLGIDAPSTGSNATITKKYALTLNGTGANLGMNGFIEGAYQIRSSAASGATIAAGAGSGTGASGSVSGNDMAGKIDITTGSSPSTSATIVTITFNAAYASAPTVILTPGNAASAALTGGTQVFISSTSTTNFIVLSGSTALSASTQYIWYYHVIQ